ncbi:MAG: 1-acyl-sn-glycerol-3-phosphate acyltransferase [Rhodobacteraceae bacterium]|nr:MAG: 1-acyl-sn-glycerol-3-phosphate acyltransferase [Paracoccaceae bacterium]
MRILVFNLWFYSFAFLCAMVAWVPAKLGRPAAVRAVIAWWTRRVLGAVRVVLKGRIEVRGRERLPPGGPQLIVSKHQSELDAILLYALFPHFRAVVMQELERYPFVGPIIAALDYIAVSVDNGPQGRTQAVVEGAREALEAGRPVLIYPEATLMSLGARERYKSGAGRIYAATGCVATPVALSLGAIWPRRDWAKRVGAAGALEFLEPIPPGLDQETFMREVEERIETASMRLIREHAVGADLAAAERRHADARRVSVET